MRSAIISLLIGLTAAVSQAQTTLPSGYWTEEQSAEILAKTEVRIRAAQGARFRIVKYGALGE